MSAIRDKAVDLLIACGIDKVPLTLEDLEKICDKLSYRLMTFEEGMPLIQEMKLEENLVSGAFFMAYKDCKLIFYSASLPYEQKLIMIAHEIAHLYLGHSYTGHAAEQSPKVNRLSPLEEEATQFARYLFAPLSVLHTLGIGAVEEIQRLTALSKEQAYYTLLELEDYHPSRAESKLLKWYDSFLRQSLPQAKEPFAPRKFRYLLVGAAAGIGAVALAVGMVMFAGFRMTPPGSPTAAGGTAVSASSVMKETSEQQTFVYITPSGRRYHLESCVYLKNKGVIEISLEDAVERDYLPCRTCLPEG